MSGVCCVLCVHEMNVSKSQRSVGGSKCTEFNYWCPCLQRGSPEGTALLFGGKDSDETASLTSI